MNERQTIEYVNSLDIFEKHKIYGHYYCNILHGKYVSLLRQNNPYFYPVKHLERYDIEISVSNSLLEKTFEQFTSESNIIKHDAGNDWEMRGYASKEWINLNPSSIYHYVYHNTK